MCDVVQSKGSPSKSILPANFSEFDLESNSALEYRIFRNVQHTSIICRKVYFRTRSPTVSRVADASREAEGDSNRGSGIGSVMAPPVDPISPLGPDERPISSLLIVIAMQAEALPLVNKFNLSEDQGSLFPKGIPWIRYHGTYKDLQINIVIPGKDAVFGVDSVGTVTSALVTYASVELLNPDIILNVGTAGGFKVKGANIGDVYLASDVAFHDRRIPIPVFDQYGIGARTTFATPNLVKEVGLKVGKLSTGDSLDMCSQDEEVIRANDATIKDMEGAAVAYVSDLLSVPVIFVKAITDVIDGEKPTSEEFLENLAAVSLALDEAVTRVVDFISGKKLSDL